MSPFRIADAARLSPYPVNIRAQETERFDASGSGSGSGSPSKARLANSRPRQERPVNRQEEERFNIGPRNIRNWRNRRGNRAGHSSRGALEGIDEAVPDYPPPSFQEAISSPSFSTTTIGPSPMTGSLELPRCLSEPQHEVSEADVSFSQPEGRESPSGTPPLSGSEDSLEIVENTSPERLVMHDRSIARGIEFPSPTPSLVSPTVISASVSPVADAESRGRAKTKLQSVLDLTADIPKTPVEDSAVRSAKKRFLSLSPLRTLFPPRHHALEARAFSAHPTPGSSPYATPTSTHFFRSTTSLATTSVFRLPFSGSSLTLSMNKCDNNRSKKMSHKEIKEERGLRHSSESLESWEILESDDLAPKVPQEPEAEPELEPPLSLMSAVAAMSNTSLPPAASPTVSPTRSVSFTYGAPTPQAASPPQTSIVAVQRTQTATAVSQSLNEPHPLSLRDRKIAEAMEPLLRRHPRKEGRGRRKTSPRPAVTIPTPPSGEGPPLVTVRTRVNHNSTKLSPLSTGITLGSGVLEPMTPQGSAVGEDVHNFQRALDTPLPSSPTRISLLSDGSSSPSSVTINVSSPTTPVAVPSGVTAHDGSGGNAQPSAVPTPRPRPMQDTPLQISDTLSCSCNHPPSSTKLSGVPVQGCNTPAVSHQIYSPMSSGNRHHYRGRPLPRPPQARNVVDSIYAGHEEFPSQVSNGSPQCPEGLLIDLDNDADQDSSGSWTPPADGSRRAYSTSAPMTPAIPSPIGSSTSTPDASVRSLPLSFSSANARSIGALSEMTDLDMLVAALGDGSSGADYETLTLISDFLGPADATPNHDTGTDPVDESNMSLAGRVEVQRRRVTPDGRVKLKLSVLGVAVNKCGICLSQFRERQYVSMSPSCRHVFHENCLRQWLVRSRTCPLCRVILISGSH